MRTIVWFRGKDLRVADHAPLADALAKGEVIPLFVLDPYFFSPARARAIAPRMQFLLDSLAELERTIAALGSRLVILEGRAVDVVPAALRAWRADRVVACSWSEPTGAERDRRVARDVSLELFEGETLAPTGSIRSRAGRPLFVFTPFARAFRARIEVAPPLPAPRSLPPLPALPAGPRAARVPACEDLGIERNPRLPAGGEAAARARLRAFLDGRAARYAKTRDALADEAGTSRLSADLHFGTLSVRTVWRATARALEPTGPRSGAWASFSNELLWRELAHHVLAERPDVLSRPFQPAWERFPWRDDERAWRAWRDGQTGIPLADAAARQLLAEGFVHNRARMIAATVLAKHMMCDFRLGERHYLEHLVDGDWANNDLGWQWTAGCGTDAQPWFRVLSPTLQGERFDPRGAYVRRWVPELAQMDVKYIHRPWDAPAPPPDYPSPVVDLAAGRARFLAAAKAHLATSRRPSSAT